MLKRKKLLILILIVLILFYGLYLFCLKRGQIKIGSNKEFLKYSEEAIDQNGIINNKYFNINSNAENPKETVEGINNALTYANKFNIKSIKLEKGIYLINSSIVFKSNVCLDMNGATVKYETNDKEQYSILKIYNCENVNIENGIILGDKDTHKYVGDSTHEWGMGIDVMSSENVDINNVEIYNCTGDGIQISKQTNIVPNNINIYDCCIHNCRREGISVICANNIKIYNNEIYDILGTGPQCCINIETDNIKNEIENIKIYGNKLSTEYRRIAVLFNKGGRNIEFYENYIEGGICTNEVLNIVNITNNFIKNGDIIFELNDWMIQNGYVINQAYVEENTIDNGDIVTNDLDNISCNNNNIL